MAKQLGFYMREAHSATHMKNRSKSQEKFAATAVRSERTICLNAAETIFCPNTGTKEWDLECIRSLSFQPLHLTAEAYRYVQRL